MFDGCGNGSGAWFAIVGVGVNDDPYIAFSATASKKYKKICKPA